MTEDEMVGCHHQLNGDEFEQTPGNGEEKGSLTYCSLLSHKESDTTSTEQQQTSSVGPFISHFAVKEMEI